VTIGPQLKELGVVPSLAFITYDTPRYVKELAGSMRACGQMGSIVEDDKPVPVNDMGMFVRALSFHWEFMFAKTMHKYQEETQGKIVEHLAKMAADGTLVSTITTRDVLSVAALRNGHELQSSGKAMGKIAFSFPEALS
jgi:NADPH2:quinone reductase